MEATSISVVVTVGANQYTIWDEFEGFIDPSIFSDNAPAYLPATAVISTKDNFNDKDLSHITSLFSSDDVWNKHFTYVIILQQEDCILVKYPGGGKVNRVPKSEHTNLPNGPYLINTRSGKVHAVARCFEDSLHAFTGGGVAYDISAKKYKPLNSHRYSAPSKLYYELSPSKPLLGLRFAVKDVIDIAGLKTGNGSCCWKDVYPAAEESALFIQQLTNAGAILMGKLNCTQFCDGQDPSERHVTSLDTMFEKVSPFNPRGDGYQLPSSSSSGSAAAAAGYDWLDFTIGTDTGGSIRHPAGVNGTYGIRPTFHSVDSSGMVASSFMDTVGIFARSAQMLERAQKGITSPLQKFAQPASSGARYKLLYPVRSGDANPDDYPKWFSQPGQSSNHAEVDSIFEDFVTKLEGHLNCKRQIFNLDELWSKTHPDTMDANLSKATATTYQRLVYYATAHDVITPFIAKYQADRDGRTPYLEPIFKKRFEYGSNVTKSEYDEAVQEFKTFKTWLLNVLFTPHSDEIGILLYPQSWGLPFYRDESRSKSSGIFWEGFSSYSISYVSGCPDITVPVGQVSYQSRITGQEELLPVSLSFLSQPGNDHILTSLLKELEVSAVLRPVQTGTKTY